MGITETAGESSARKTRRRAPTSFESLDTDILCIIFSFLDLFDLVHCTVVCNSWYAVIKKLKLLQSSCRRMHQVGSTSLEQPREIDVEDFAMKHHKMALLRGRIEIERWEAHSHRWGNVHNSFFFFFWHSSKCWLMYDQILSVSNEEGIAFNWCRW